MKLLGIVETAGDPTSNDTEKEEFDCLVKETFLAHYPEAVNIIESVYTAQKELEEKSKCCAFQEDEDKPKQACPIGRKKTK